MSKQTLNRRLPVNGGGLVAKKSRIGKSVLLGSIAGVVICIAAAFLIPLKDEDPLLSTDDAALRYLQTNPAESEPDAPAVKLEPTLRLPQVSVASEVDVAALQNELRMLGDRLIADYPGETGSYHVAAQIFFELKQSEKAEQLWNQCIDRSPQHMGPYVGLATLLMEKGRDKDAIEVLSKAERLGGNSPEMQLKLGEAHENLGEIATAENRLLSAVKSFPKSGELWQALGRVQNQNNQPAAAEQSLRRAIELDGEKEPVLFALNASLTRQGKNDESMAIREKLTKLKRPKRFEDDTFQQSYDSALTRIAGEIFMSAAAIEENFEKWDNANRLYLRACEISPEAPTAYQGLLMMARRQGRLADQKLILEKLLTIEPKNIMHYTNLASVAVQMNDLALARSTLENAVVADPQGILAQAASAKLFLNLREYEKARQMASIVLERQPSPAAYRLLAATYHGQGMMNEFVAAIQKADDLEKSNLHPDLRP